MSTSTSDTSLSEFLERCEMAVSISDPSLPDNPLVWINDAFETLTGYSSEQCIGKNCRFLQGPMTRNTDVRAIASTLANRRVERTEILNYRANGQPFHNSVIVGPVRAANNEVQRFFGIQWDVTMSERLAGTEPETGNAVSPYRQRISQRRSLSRYLLEQTVKRSSLLGNDLHGFSLIERLAASLRPEQFPLEGDVNGSTPVSPMLEFILRPYVQVMASSIELSGEDTHMTPDAAAVLALVFHEIIMHLGITSHPASPRGELKLTWRSEHHLNMPTMVFEWTETARQDRALPVRETDMSSLLITDSLKQINGSMEVISGTQERCLRIRVPREQLTLSAEASRWVIGSV